MLDLARHRPSFEKLWRKSAHIEVAEQIRAKIFSEKLKLFQRLPTERELAEQFGVSRVVVREAIRTLESSGLVAVKKGPKGGIFVARDYDRPIADSIGNLLAGGEMKIEDLFEVRLLIEPYAAARVAETGTTADFDALDAKIAEAAREHNADKSVRHRYIEFHREILRLTRNSLLSIVGEAALLVVYDHLKDALSANTTKVGLAMHKRLVEALRRRAPAEARDIMATDIAMLRARFAKNSSPAKRKTAAKSARATTRHQA
jgi:DNA-binding FadR family transcriptional regulator